MEFPTWFALGCYGGLACCMVAIATQALYTSWRRRGTTRQLSWAVVACVVAALLLLPAIIWYNLRFADLRAALSAVEIELALIYIMFFGWVLPLGVTTSYCLFAPKRIATGSMPIASQKRTTRVDSAASVPGVDLPPPGQPAAYVFDADTPWGWLEHRNGRFQGQRLALKRAIITMGRGEENEIWLDDDLASRHHADLIWSQGRVFITDHDSLNGVLVNGQRIRGVALVSPGELLEVGSHRFNFEFAKPPEIISDLNDPLLRHAPRSSMVGMTHSSASMPITPLPSQPLDDLASTAAMRGVFEGPQLDFDGHPSSTSDSSERWEDTAVTRALDPTSQLMQTRVQQQHLTETHAFIICNGTLSGRNFLLERAVLTIGRGSECDVVIDDPSISRRHAQLLRQVNGTYLQDLVSRNGTTVNNEPLWAPRLLQSGDLLCLGDICIQYVALANMGTTPLARVDLPSLVRPTHGPQPLSLPSRPFDL